MPRLLPSGLTQTWLRAHTATRDGLTSLFTIRSIIVLVASCAVAMAMMLYLQLQRTSNAIDRCRKVVSSLDGRLVIEYQGPEFLRNLCQEYRVQAFDRITDVHITTSAIHAWELEQLANAPGLECLFINCPVLPEGGLLCFSASRSLTCFAFGGETLQYTNMVAISQIETLASLMLHLDYCSVNGIRRMAYLPSLTNLSLNGCRVTSDMLTAVADAPSLRSLSLAYTELDGDLSRLSGNSALSEIDLSHTKVGDEDLHDITHIGTIERINLRNTDLTESGLRSLLNIPSITSVTVSDSDVSDEFAHECRLSSAPLTVIYTID